VEGLFGNETQSVVPGDRNSTTYQVNDQAPYVDPDPDHSVPGTTLQCFGYAHPNSVSVAPMNGFVTSALNHSVSPQSVMSCFNEDTVPAISTIAKEFSLFNRWFADVPGPTEVNRMYVQSSTSDGAGDNDNDHLAIGYPQRTIYDDLHKDNKTFNVFFSDFPTAFFLERMRFPPYLESFHQIDEFESWVNKGKLAAYTFVEPRYFSIPEFPANDQHPSHDVAEGEHFFNRIYKILRKGPT